MLRMWIFAARHDHRATRLLGCPIFCQTIWVIVWLGLTGCGGESNYPDRPVLLLCPWGVGGGTDLVSRQLAFYLEKELEVPVNVVNATGGSGVTAHSRGARANPDGYTLLMMTVEINMLHWNGLTGLTWEDYSPLMLVNRDAAAVFVRANSDWKTLDELSAALRTDPGKLRGAGSTTGGIWHLAFAGWLTSLGMQATDINWIPNNGAAASLKELASSGIDVVCCSVPEARSYLAAGQCICLGVMSSTPVKGFEQLPTFETLGQPWRMGGWRGLAAPRGLSKPVTDRLLLALDRIISGKVTNEGKTFLDFMDSQGFDASTEGPKAFRQTLASTDKKLGDLLTSEAFASLQKDSVSPMTYPLILGSLIALALVGLLMSGGPRTVKRVYFKLPRSGMFHFVEIICAIIAYVLLAEIVGFLLTAGTILFILLMRFGTRLWPSLAITILVVPGIYLLFSQVLRVMLPQGFMG